MNRFRLVATLTMLVIVAGTMSSQQTAPNAGGADKQEHAQSTPAAVDQHLKMLSEKLDLAVDQQAEIRPILKQMLDARQKVARDNSLTDDARQEKERSLQKKAGKQVRKFLNDDQKKKLDELERQPHS